MATDVINPKYTVFDLGYEKCLAKSDSFYDDQGANADKVTDSLPSILIGGGGLIGNITMVDGFMQSSNYVAGSTGWKLTETTAYLPSIDLSGYLLATGGAYKTAATGSRVEIFPDANTGIIAYDSGGSAVLTVLVGGTNEGDVIMGGASAYAKWDKSAGTFTVIGAIQTGVGSVVNGEYIDSLSVGKLATGTITSQGITLSAPSGSDCYIRAGKTDFGQYTTKGFILGVDVSDSSAPKFEITGGEIYGTLINFYFGDGFGGDITYSAETTLTGDKYCHNLIINEGVILHTNGYKIYALGEVTINGIVDCSGGNGSNGSNAVTWPGWPDGYIHTANGGAGGAGGGAVGSTFGQALSGASGGKSELWSDYGHGDQSTVGGSGTNKNPSLGSSGVAGGAGGQNSDGYTGTAGGLGGTATPELMIFDLNKTKYSNTINYIYQREMICAQGEISGLLLSHSASSAGGGAGYGAMIAQTPQAYGATGGAGGGGGGNGGIIFIAAKNIVIGENGHIYAKGGNGGNGGTYAYGSYGFSGGGGGGGGGAGGIIVLVYKELTNYGSISAAGGSKGSKNYNGIDGTNGNNGKIYQFKLII